MLCLLLRDTWVCVPPASPYPQHIETGSWDAVFTYNMPGDAYESCGCILSHLLRRPLLSLHGIPFITAPWGVPQASERLGSRD